MLKFLFLLAVFYGAVVILVYFVQRRLQYYPNRVYPGKPAAHGLPQMQEIQVTTEDGLNLVAWFAPPKNQGQKIIVFYHGNAGNLADRAPKAREWLNAGYGVYMCEYRGYAGNKGSPAEDGFYKDARAALRWLDKSGYTPSQWVFYGESLGTGMAVEMAREFQVKALILESPFTSATDVAKVVYFWLPVAYLLKDRFDNLGKIKDIKASLLIVHGDEDPVIPHAQAHDLYTAANHPKEFVTIENGKHNDLYEHHAGHIILEWLAKQG